MSRPGSASYGWGLGVLVDVVPGLLLELLLAKRLGRVESTASWPGAVCNFSGIPVCPVIGCSCIANEARHQPVLTQWGMLVFARASASPTGHLFNCMYTQYDVACQAQACCGTVSSICVKYMGCSNLTGEVQPGRVTGA